MGLHAGMPLGSGHQAWMHWNRFESLSIMIPQIMCSASAAHNYTYKMCYVYFVEDSTEIGVRRLHAHVRTLTVIVNGASIRGLNLKLLIKLIWKYAFPYDQHLNSCK